MKALLRGLVAVLVVSMLVPVAFAQEGSRKQPVRGAIVVNITALQSGRVVEVEDPKTKRRQKRTVDRKLQYTVGKAVCATSKEMFKVLNRTAANPASMRADPGTGGKKLAALRISPGPNVQWAEIVHVLDLGNRAGFSTVELHGIGDALLIPKAIDNPAVDKTDLIVPPCMFCDPSSRAPENLQVFDVHRDGRVVADGRSIFEWKAGEAEQLVPLRKQLGVARAKMEELELMGARPGHDGDWVEMPIRVRADREVVWRDQLRLLRELVKPEFGFWKLEIAVAEIATRLR